MENSRIDQPMNIQTNATGRRDALRGLSTAGMTLLATLGVGGAAAAKPRNSGGNGGGGTKKGRETVQTAKKKKGKTKTGPAGPAGAPGAPGPAGANGADIATTVVGGDKSEGLSAEAGAVESSEATCGGAGKVLSCGYVLEASAAESVNVLVIRVFPDSDRSSCFAAIRRTTEVGSAAGATIQAVALCRS